MAHLCIDIEAILDPLIPCTYTEGDKLPAAPHWQIVCIGAVWLDDNLCAQKATCLGDDEVSALLSFARILEEKKPTILGYNSRNFDMPVIESRLMRHGIQCPRLFSRDVQDRYYGGHIDLMDRIANHGAATRPGLGPCAQLVGFPGKGDCNGSQVAEMVAAGRIEEVRAYCLRDVVQMVAVYLRREYVRGAIDLGKYQTAARALLALIESTPRLEAMRGQIDERRFLLE